MAVGASHLDRQTEGDCSKVWSQHCSNEEQRKQYAECMHQLATSVWKSRSRIEWCYNTARNYFFEGGLQRFLIRDAKKQKRILSEEDILNVVRELQIEQGQLSLLDVGSCYNPFKVYPEFNTIAVDLTPSTEDVLECDFLKVTASDTTCHNDLNISLFLKNPITLLPGKYFHIIIFSLLLDYLPSRLQRWQCCITAHKLLRFNGLLLIITPDSKNQHRNSKLMKSWREALESIGFQRVYYHQEQRLNCMGFRKTTLLTGEKSDPDKLYIHQDFRDYSSKFCNASIKERTEDDDRDVFANFEILPQFI